MSEGFRAVPNRDARFRLNAKTNSQERRAPDLLPVDQRVGLFFAADGDVRRARICHLERNEGSRMGNSLRFFASIRMTRSISD
jgi:hypothetical protein